MNANAKNKMTGNVIFISDGSVKFDYYGSKVVFFCNMSLNGC